MVGYTPMIWEIKFSPYDRWCWRMTEDEAILFLLDLGTGASNRYSYNQEALDKVDEIQEMCSITEGDERELKKRLSESDDVSVTLGQYALTYNG
jgi:hypothetical protein